MNRFVRGGSRMLAPVMLAVGALGGVSAVPALAQSTAQPAETTEQKLRRMDAEIKALQRKVFPEAGSKFFAPEIAPTTTPPADSPPTGTPAAGPLTDLLARMDALEGQVTRLTAQVEESQNRIGKLEAQVAALQPPAAPAADATTPAATSPAPAGSNGATIASNTAAMTGGASKPAATPAPTPASSPAAKPAAPAANRIAAVQAIEKPQTNDRGEDEYTYGFRLWDAKFYPEAQQQLQSFLRQYPRHRRTSYARNLLGRAYLEDGMPGAAATTFVENYNTEPGGDRAPDSLLYLAVAMDRLKQKDKACVALSEMAEKYPAVVTGRLAGDVARVRDSVKCN